MLPVQPEIFLFVVGTGDHPTSSVGSFPGKVASLLKYSGLYVPSSVSFLSAVLN